MHKLIKTYRPKGTIRFIWMCLLLSAVSPKLLLASVQLDTPFQEFEAKLQTELIDFMNFANRSSYIAYGPQGSESAPEGDLPSKHWEKVGNYQFELKPGISAYEAIDTVFDGGQRSWSTVKLECHTMMMAIFYRALAQTIGKEKFDREFNGKMKLIKGDLKASGLSKYFLKPKSPKKTKVKPGDWVYFQNHKNYLEKHPLGAWQGENALVVEVNTSDPSQNQYSGYGVSARSESAMNEVMLDKYNKDSTAEEKEINQRDNHILKSISYEEGIPTVSEDGSVLFTIKNSFFLDHWFLAINESPFDFIYEVFDPIAKKLGYQNSLELEGRYEIEIDDVLPDTLPVGDLLRYNFFVRKLKTYSEKIELKDIPGLIRIDRPRYRYMYNRFGK